MELSRNALTDIYHSSDQTIQFAHDEGMTVPEAPNCAPGSYQKPETRSGEVVVTKVDPRVLQMALGMAADRACIEIGDDGSILVKNFPGQFGS